MIKHLISATLSLSILAGCSADPALNVLPTASPIATVKPGSGLVPQGQGVTLTGQIALAASDLVVEASDTAKSFRASTVLTTNTYQLAGVPVGRQIRLQTQYRKNPNVILSARQDIGADMAGKTVPLNINLDSTVTDLIYERALSKNLTKITSTPIAQFESNTGLATMRGEVLQVLQKIMVTPLDNITQTVPLAADLLAKIDQVLPQIDAVLNNQPVPSAVPTPSVSATPTPTPVVVTPTVAPTVTPSGPFVPVRLIIKPGTDVKLARDAALRFVVTGVDAQGREQAVVPNWNSTSNSVAGTMDATGLFSPRSAGDLIFTASVGGLSETVRITINDADLSSLEFVPDQDITVDSQRPIMLQIKGKDSRGADVSLTPTWTLSNASIGSVDANGVFTGLQTGSTDVTARARGFSRTIRVKVEAGSSFILDVDPKDSPTVLTGQTQLFKVLARDIINNSSSFLFTYAVADTNIGTIDSSGLFRALKPGSTSIQIRDSLNNTVSTSVPVIVADGAPYITGLNPANAIVSPGQTITLTGQNFAGGSGNVVRFNDVQANVISGQPDAVTVTVPSGVVSGFISITADGRKGNGIPFIVAPRIDSLSPNEANENEVVSIFGQNFSPTAAHNVVFFGVTRAGIPFNVTNTSMQVIVPAVTSSSSDVSVYVKGYISSNVKEFKSSISTTPTWTERRATISARSMASAEVIDGIVYVVGGEQSGTTQKLESYSITNDDWTSKQDLPDSRTLPSTAVLDSKLYAIGGGSESTRVDRYDPGNNTWTQRASLTTGRSRHVAESYNSKIYVIGGSSSSDVGRSVEQYNPDDDKWRTKATSPTRRFDAASAVLDGRIYVIGGGSPAEDRVTAYDPSNDQWLTNFSPLPRPLTQASAVTVNGRIYVFGGLDQNGNAVDTVYEYNPSTDRWRTVNRMPAVRYGAAVSSQSSRVYVVGGRNGSGSTTTNVFRGSF